MLCIQEFTFLCTKDLQLVRIGDMMAHLRMHSLKVPLLSEPPSTLVILITEALNLSRALHFGGMIHFERASPKLLIPTLCDGTPISNLFPEGVLPLVD